MKENHLIDIETKLAYLEDTMQTLNDILVRQQRDIERLTARFTEVLERMKTAESAADNTTIDERPPHY